MALPTETLLYNKTKTRYYTSQYSGDDPLTGLESRVCFYKTRSVSTAGTGTVCHGSTSTKVTSLTYRQYLYGSSSISAYGAISSNRSLGITGTGSYSIYAYTGTNNRTFVGWYDTTTKVRYTTKAAAASSTGIVIDSSSATHVWIGGSLEDVKLTAVFGIKFTVYFRPNGGTGSTTDAYLVCYNEAGAWYVRKAPTNNSSTRIQFAAPAGKSFVGWNTKADGTGTSVSVGADMSTLSSTADAKVYLYAQWEDSSKVKVTNGNTDTVTLSLEDSDGEVVATETDGVIDTYADPGLQYTISATYDEGIVSSVKVSGGGSDHTLPYSFTPSSGDEIELTSEATYVPLYSVTAVYDSSKGSVVVSPSPDHDGKWKSQDITFTVTANAGYMPTKYKFNSGSYQDIPADGIVVLQEEDFTADTTAYFSFSAAEYTVSAGVEASSRARGTATSSRTGSVAEGESVTFTATAADSMFTFAGWYKKDGTSVSTSNPYTVSVSGSLALYARFSTQEGEGTVKVSYAEGSSAYGYISVGNKDNTPGGSGAGLKEISYTSSNGSPVKISAMVASGCRFVGWYEYGELISDSSVIETFVKDGREIVAEFDDDGGKVYEWEGSSENKTLVWRSKTYVLQRPINPSVVRVDTLGYDVKSVKVELFSAPDSEPTAKANLENVENQTVRRLPVRRMERYLQVEVSNDKEVDAVYVGTSAGGIAV